MVSVRLDGIHKVKKILASGTAVIYHYAWRGGPRFWQSDSDIRLGSPEYLNALREVDEHRSNSTKGYFSSIIQDYEQRALPKLSERTQKDYKIWINRIDAKFGSAPIRSFNRPNIRPVALKWRNQWSGRQAKYALSVLARIVAWAYDECLLEYHHLKGGKSSYSSDRADIIWTKTDLAAFHKQAPAHVSRALTAAVETGLRPGDLVTLSRSHIQDTPKGQRILIRTKKKNRLASIPVTKELAKLIAATPKNDLLILRTSKGKPWTPVGLSQMVKKAALKAELDNNLRLYDARGTACTRLLLIKTPLSDIAMIMGWSVATTAQMIEVYAVLDPGITDSVLTLLNEAKNGT